MPAGGAAVRHLVRRLGDPDLTIIEQLQKDFPREGLGPLRSLAGAYQKTATGGQISGLDGCVL